MVAAVMHLDEDRKATGWQLLARSLEGGCFGWQRAANLLERPEAVKAGTGSGGMRLGMHATEAVRSDACGRNRKAAQVLLSMFGV